MYKSISRLTIFAITLTLLNIFNTGTVEAVPPVVNGCQIFPTDNPWNIPVTNAVVHPNSDAIVNNIGRFDNLHPDFGTFWEGGPIGIPFVVVNNSQPNININFTEWPEESDPGPYPIPLNAPIEGGASSSGDRHVIALDTDDCKLYELYRGFPQSTFWNAYNGAIFDLTSNVLRPNGWTSADAAGLPIYPGLVKYSEVQAGVINHAIRFTVNCTADAYVYPATHKAPTCSGSNRPPMGARFRLKESWYNANKDSFSGPSRVIVDALRNYGMILADNGSDWYISGEHNANWNDSLLNPLKSIEGDAFEMLDMKFPSPTFTANQTSFYETTEGAVQFTNTTTGEIDSYLWDFGDGQTSTQVSPAHQYTAEGSYTVKLTATIDGVSRTMTKPYYILVTKWNQWVKSGASSVTSVSMETFGTKLFQSVTATNGLEYTRIYENGSWGAWSSSGASSTAKVEMEVLGTKLFQSVSASNGLEYTRIYENGSWGAWTRSGASSSARIKLKTFGSKLFQSVSASTKVEYTRIYENGSWGAWTKSGASSAGGVEMEVFGTKLFQSVNGANGLEYTRYYEGNSWSPWIKSGASSIGAVEMEVMGTKLFQSVTGGNSMEYTRIYESGTWGAWVKSGASSTASVKMKSFDNKIYQSVSAINGLEYTRIYNGTSWGPWNRSGATSIGGVELEVFGDRLFQAVTGSNKLEYTHSREV